MTTFIGIWGHCKWFSFDFTATDQPQCFEAQRPPLFSSIPLLGRSPHQPWLLPDCWRKLEPRGVINVANSCRICVSRTFNPLIYIYIYLYIMNVIKSLKPRRSFFSSNIFSSSSNAWTSSEVSYPTWTTLEAIGRIFLNGTWQMTVIAISKWERFSNWIQLKP